MNVLKWFLSNLRILFTRNILVNAVFLPITACLHLPVCLLACLSFCFFACLWFTVFFLPIFHCQSLCLCQSNFFFAWGFIFAFSALDCSPLFSLCLPLYPFVSFCLSISLSLSLLMFLWFVLSLYVSLSFSIP